MHKEGGAITYCRRYSLLAILGLNAGIPDNDGDFANPTTDKVTTINKGKSVPTPHLLDDDTKQYYLKVVGELLIKDKSLFTELSEAMFVEFDFDRNKKLSENITLPKHVTYIEEWLTTYTK